MFFVPRLTDALLTHGRVLLFMWLYRVRRNCFVGFSARFLVHDLACAVDD